MYLINFLNLNEKQKHSVFNHSSAALSTSSLRLKHPVKNKLNDENICKVAFSVAFSEVKSYLTIFFIHRGYFEFVF